ncbi:ATP-binding protein [Streptomyces sp. B1866]|uniref:ATP-binding protein n=1 Tax=Streptomyces sp. B1866 TaxID=3075431 RepID=UPI00288CFEA4|nr:ATP-binding protein [Streptomyces sp. B1866]MDT3396205.1 ATP-binding protein [Streptomyces sp. B1866]
MTGATATPQCSLRDLTIAPRQLAELRRLSRQVMRLLGVSRAAEAIVLQGLTELLSNVAKHVPVPRCSVQITHADGTVRVAVCDCSARPPEVTTPDWDSESGRGLWLLREMASDFGWEPTADGKRVWFTV